MRCPSIPCWPSGRSTRPARTDAAAGTTGRRYRRGHPSSRLEARPHGDPMTVKRLDNVGIVVEDLDAAVAFFTELGLELEMRVPIEGDWAGDVTGLPGQRVEIAMMRTPDGHGRLELCRYLAPP